MSGQAAALPPGSGYGANAPGYGAATVAEVNHTSNPTSYTCRPTDDLVLIDLSGYSGSGVTINWSPTPVERLRVCVRNTTGSASAKPITVAAPSGLTIEDPANPGTFAATVVSSVANFSGIWEFDRANARLVVACCSGAAGGTTPTAITFDTADSTPHTVATIPLPASPGTLQLVVNWTQYDTASATAGGSGMTKSSWRNAAGTATQFGSTADVFKDASVGSSVSFDHTGASVLVQVNGNGDNHQHWTLYIYEYPSVG